MLVFVACAKSKLPITCKAREMYTPSPIFKKRMEYALSLTSEDKVYILSGKYGLLKLNDVIDTYDCFLGSESKEYRKEWRSKVLKQMKEEGIDFKEETYFAAGKEYWNLLVANFPNSTVEQDIVRNELNDGGIGVTMHFYDLKNKAC